MTERSRKEYKLKSAFDVAELFASLDDEGRAILAKDLQLGGEMLRDLPWLLRALVRITDFTWIDDDKGNGTFRLSAKAGGPELVRWERKRT